MTEKETRTKLNTFSNFISPSMAPLHIITWNYVPSIVNLLKAIYKTFMYVLLGRLVFKDSCYLFSTLYYSLFVPATPFPTYPTYCHSKIKPRIVSSPTRYVYISVW